MVKIEIFKIIFWFVDHPAEGADLGLQSLYWTSTGWPYNRRSCGNPTKSKYHKGDISMQGWDKHLIWNVLTKHSHTFDNAYSETCSLWLSWVSFRSTARIIPMVYTTDLLWYLTHWGRVTHICVSELTIIGSDNGLSPGRRQAIICNNAGLLLIEPLGTNFSDISIGIQTFSFKKMHLNMSSGKWRPFCLGLNVLRRVDVQGVSVCCWKGVNLCFTAYSTCHDRFCRCSPTAMKNWYADQNFFFNLIGIWLISYFQEIHNPYIIKFHMCSNMIHVPFGGRQRYCNGLIKTGSRQIEFDMVRA